MYALIDHALTLPLTPTVAELYADRRTNSGLREARITATMGDGSYGIIVIVQSGTTYYRGGLTDFRDLEADIGFRGFAAGTSALHGILSLHGRNHHVLMHSEPVVQPETALPVPQPWHLEHALERSLQLSELGNHITIAEWFEYAILMQLLTRPTEERDTSSTQAGCRAGALWVAAQTDPMLAQMMSRWFCASEYPTTLAYFLRADFTAAFYRVASLLKATA